MKERVNQLILYNGIVLLFLTGCLFLTGSVSLLLNTPLSSVHLYVALAITILFICFCANQIKIDKMQKLVFLFSVNTLFVVIIVCLSAWVSTQFIDLSEKGQKHHQEVIYYLSEGWNPIYDDKKDSEWANIYPKASEIIATMTYLATGNWEQGKSYYYVLLMASFCLSLSALLHITRNRWAASFVLAMLLTLNPLAVSGWASFQVSGIAAILLLCLLSFCVLIYYDQHNIILYVSYALLLILMTNISYSSLLFAIICTLFFFTVLYSTEKMEALKFTAITSLCAIIVSFVFFGYHPFMTNLWEQGDMFLPTVELVTGENAINENVIHPFQRLSEINWLNQFGRVFVFVLVLATVVIIISGRNHVWPTLGALAVISAILLSVKISNIIIPEVIAPQVWFIPVIVIILGLLLQKKHLKVFSWMLIFGMVINVVTECMSYIDDQQKEQSLYLADIDYLNEREKVEVILVSGQSDLKKLETVDVSYEVIRRMNCRNPKLIHNTGIMFCPEERK